MAKQASEEDEPARSELVPSEHQMGNDAGYCSRREAVDRPSHPREQGLGPRPRTERFADLRFVAEWIDDPPEAPTVHIANRR
jgi:hypothetical protein